MDILLYHASHLREPMSDTQEPYPDILAFILDGNGGARKISTKALNQYSPDQGILWVHLNFTDPLAENWLKNESGLDEVAILALTAQDTRPRVAPLDDGLIVALRGVNHHPKADPEDMVAIRIWIEENKIVTSRKRNLLSVDDLIHSLESGKGPTSAASFLIDLADRLVWRMSDTVDDLEDAIDDLEDQVLDSKNYKIMKDLAQIRRQTIAIRRYLAPQKEALNRIFSEKIKWMTYEHKILLREVNDRLVRHIEDLDSVRERAAVTQEELHSRVSDQTNSRMYILSIVAAIFLPLGFLTGLLGVNLGGIPGAENPSAFPIFLAVLTATIIVQITFFLWKKWL